MNRRKFLVAGTVAAIAGGVSTSVTPTLAEAAATPIVGPLNPPGIRTAGIRMIPVVNGKYKVWTKRIGSGSLKVLALHGGPGFGHEYLEAFEDFLPAAGIEFYYYDQLGCNNSDQPEDATLWTLPRYVEEVEEVRRGLGLDKFVLYGHSWGGCLALEYALKYQQHLRGLVVSNMAPGMEAFRKRIDWWKTQLPAQERTRLAAFDASKDYESAEYQQFMMDVVWPRMICRTQPWPESLTRALRHVNEKIYVQMQGRSEFIMDGNLKDWERWDRLHEIEVRTLTIGAKYDEMDPEDMKRMAGRVGNGKYAYCADGSHLSMWDDQESYFRQLLGFLREV